MEESLVSCFSICAVCVKIRRKMNGIKHQGAGKYYVEKINGKRQVLDS